MRDREKVIKGLECCVNDLGECDFCPYDEGRGKLACGKNLYSDAIALLKAQEPVKPIPGLWDRDIQLFICGECGGEIGAGGIAKYCFHCGRAVKWK
jgi:hypothetical protein